MGTQNLIATSLEQGVQGVPGSHPAQALAQTTKWGGQTEAEFFTGTPVSSAKFIGGFLLTWAWEDDGVWWRSCAITVLEHSGMQFQFCSPTELIKVLKHCRSLSASQQMA